MPRIRERTDIRSEWDSHRQSLLRAVNPSMGMPFAFLFRSIRVLREIGGESLGSATGDVLGFRIICDVANFSLPWKSVAIHPQWRPR